VVVAEGLQALQHGVDLGLGGDECVKGFVVRLGGAAGDHGRVSYTELHRFLAIRLALSRHLIN